jgi:hypothetical protein
VTDFKGECMAILQLHQLNNPEELELIDSTDIASVDEANGHSYVLLHSGVVKYVAEPVSKIFDMMMGGN